MSDDHFTVDTPESLGFAEGFRPKDDPEPPAGGRNREVSYKGETRRNETRESRTDPAGAAGAQKVRHPRLSPDVRHQAVGPQVAQNESGSRSVIDSRTTSDGGNKATPGSDAAAIESV